MPVTRRRNGNMDIVHIWKNADTSKVEALARKITAAALEEGHEIDEDDLSTMLFQSFKAGYLEAVRLAPDTTVPAA